MKTLLRWLDENDTHDLEELNAHHVRKVLVSIEEWGLSSQYQHNLARAIRAFLNFCVRDELIEQSPFEIEAGIEGRPTQAK